MIATLVLLTVISAWAALRVGRPAPQPARDYPPTLLLPVNRHPDLTRPLYHASRPKSF